MKPNNLKIEMKKFLPKKLQDKALRGFEVVGNVCIIEIPSELDKYDTKIAKVLLEQKNIHTVCKKVGIHYGKYRLQKLKIISGKKSKEAVHKENHVKLKLNVEKVYFSGRTGHERERVMNLVKKGEKVLVMFSGCGPFTYSIAKNSLAKKVVGIEHNPVAHKYAEENMKLNKVDNVVNYVGDVKKVVPKLKEKFDRVIMPHPTDAGSYLEDVFKIAKKGTIVHFYDFSNEKEFAKTRKKVRDISAGLGKKIRILRLVKCGQYSPRVYRVCVDFKVIF